MTYGCYNRSEYRTVQPMQDGWYMDGVTRTPRLVAVPHRMAKDCQYTHTTLGQNDARCVGCKWRVTEKK